MFQGTQASVEASSRDLYPWPGSNGSGSSTVDMCDVMISYNILILQ